MTTPRWRIAPPTPDAPELAATLGLLPITAQVLINRGHTGAADARRFLEAPLEHLSDPERIIDLPVASARLAAAVASGERITIYGDYDADGVTATAVLIRGLRALGARTAWYVPSRFREGYGLNTDALNRLRREDHRLLVAVDCGVTAIEEIARAAGAGQEVIVVDHHEPPDRLPRALAVVDPKRPGDAGGFHEYCAAGLAFQLLRAVRARLGQEEMPLEVIDLAALGTIADVVPLVGDNRILARAGLRRMTTEPLTGIAALARVAGITGEVTARHVGFSLAPRLNAAGRLGDAGAAVRLLLTDDPEEADGIAASLDAENRARQELCQQIFAQAAERVEQEHLHDAPAIVVAGDGWHSGVIGIVASQLVERYSRPVVVMGVDGGVAKGSARSIEAFHMVDGLAACADLLTRFGGHAMAAGLTIDAAQIPEFSRRFVEAARTRLRPDDLVPSVEVDAEVELGALTEPLARELQQLAPFGAGNPEPVLGARGLQAVSTRVMGDGVHLRLGVTDGRSFAEAVGFRLGDASELLAFTRARVDLAFALSIDRWNEQDRVQLIVRDLVTPGVDLDAVLTDSRLLIDRLFARAADYLGDGALGLEDSFAFNTKVVGVTFEGRQDIVRRLSAGDLLALERQPDNPVDPHAVRVLNASGQQIGYLSARVAARLAPSIDSGTRYSATVSQVTGGPGAAQGEERSYGVNIFVQRVESMLEGLEPAAPLRAVWKDLSTEDLIERLRIHLRRGRPVRAVQAEAVRAILDGRPVLGVFGPGKGRLAVQELAVAAAVIHGGGPVAVVFPLRREAERWYERAAPRLARLGLRVVKAHGALFSRQRQRLLQTLSAGGADVIVATSAYMSHAPAELRPALVVCDGEPGEDREVTEILRAAAGAGVRCSGFVASRRSPQEAAFRDAGLGELIADTFLRTNVRLVDRRNAPDPLPIIAEVAGRGGRTVVFTGSRRQAVETAVRLREGGIQAAYYHSGIPLRVREVLEQTFADGRIAVLVSGDGLCEDAVPVDVRQVVICGLPANRSELAEWMGMAGLDGRQATVTLAYGREDMRQVERRLAEEHPSREVLTSVFRAVRARGADAAWPDEVLAAVLDAEIPSRRTIGVALDVLAEAGVILREFDGDRWRLTPAEGTGRRDLSTSLRYTEGTKEVLEAVALDRFAFGPLPELLRTVAGGEGAASRT
jgi:single-stranded-DNA-specific exonuclease